MGKSSLREGGIRMPFIVAWGDCCQTGAREPGHVMLPPTAIAALYGIARRRNATNRRHRFGSPTIRGKERRQQEHDYLCTEIPRGWVAVRWERLKGCCCKVEGGAFELCDVRHDLLEEHGDVANHWRPLAGCKFIALAYQAGKSAFQMGSREQAGRPAVQRTVLHAAKGRTANNSSEGRCDKPNADTAMDENALIPGVHCGPSVM